MISAVIGQILTLEPAQKRAFFRCICRRTPIRYAAMMPCDAERHHLRHASAEPSALLIVHALPQLHDLLRPCRRMIDAPPAPFLLLLIRTQIRLKLARILADIVVQAQEPPHRLLAESGGKAPRKIGNARQMIEQKLLASCFLIKMPKIGRRFCHFYFLPRNDDKIDIVPSDVRTNIKKILCSISTDNFHFLYRCSCTAGSKASKKPPHRTTAGGSFPFSSIPKRRVDDLLALAPVGAELVHEALEMRVVVALPEMRDLVDDDVF